MEKPNSIQRKGDRYVIVNDNGKVVDDANGYGYKTYNSAKKAMWYKYGGGKRKKDTAIRELDELFQEHSGLEKFIEDFYEMWFKELARGEVTEDELLEEIEKEFGIKFPKKLLNLWKLN